MNKREAHWIHDDKGGYWQIPVGGKPYNFRTPPGFVMHPKGEAVTDAEILWDMRHIDDHLKYSEDAAPILIQGVRRVLRRVMRPPVEAHCATCSCVPGMTPAVRFDATAAEKEGAVREQLIRMGWTPPAEAQAQGIGPEWKPCRKRPVIVHVREQRPDEQHVSTREGLTPVMRDDLIIRGVEGEEYPIGRELFAKTYDLVGAQAQGGGEVVSYERALDLFAEVYNAGRDGIGFNKQAADLFDARTDHAAAALIRKCRSALAEELAAWDIDPPLAHVKEAHDACAAFLAGDTALPSAPVGVEGWRVEPVEDDPDMLAVETPDGRTWFAKRGDRVFELAEALALAKRTSPPSAPVGVEAIAAEIRASLGRGATVSTRRRWAVELEAIAQQPAAVDEAMVERAFDAWCDVADVDEWRVRNAPEALRAALTAALAAQQGGAE